MTALALTQDDSCTTMPEVWDQRRLRELVDDVGEAGVRDLLRLFQADMAFLMAQLASAIESGNCGAACHLLATARDAAENLGLGGLAALLRDLRSRPADATFPDLLARELSRVRFVPSLNRSS